MRSFASPSLYTASRYEVWKTVNFYPLVKKLIEIERAIDVLDPREIRALVIEAQDHALLMQKEAVETLSAEYGPFFSPPVEPERGASQYRPFVRRKTERAELTTCR